MKGFTSSKPLNKGGRVNFYGTLALAIFVLISKGASGDGQGAIFSTSISDYIENTSASISQVYDSTLQSAILGSIVDQPSGLGQGGQQNAGIKPETIQDSAFLAHSPASEDYIDQTTGKRSEVVEYTVQPGDVLSFIASDYGVTTSSIIWANDLKSADNVSPGQVLRIPPVSGVIHKTVKGDTVATIASKYGVSEDEIISFNSLPKSADIKIGDEIIVPGGKITQARSIATAKTQQRFSHLPDLSSFYMAPTIGYNWGTIHGRNGVDIANSCGTPIYAAAEGTIISAFSSGYNGGFGQYLKLHHSNDTETLYAHLSKVLASNGDIVSKGQLIGLMGTTGRSTGCHLHFEVHGAKNPLSK